MENVMLANSGPFMVIAWLVIDESIGLYHIIKMVSNEDAYMGFR
ncbi:MAG: hypothetical protein ABI168_06935 [Ginsengibacter sp.]